MEERGIVKVGKSDDEETVTNIKFNFPTWRIISKVNLNVKYAILFDKETADKIFDRLEKETIYYSGDKAKATYNNRQHVAFGNLGLTYTFAGSTVPTLPWTKFLLSLNTIVETFVPGWKFNFVLINRYEDGNQFIGEHRDDERDLETSAPIASLSLGQKRDFLFQHHLRRKKCPYAPDNVTLKLEHGSLLIMFPPTNEFYYHSLPKRPRLTKPRINLTFRVIRE